jgi:hypothetical protein
MMEKLKVAIIKASNELGSNKLIYEINFWFGTPSHSLKILDVELYHNYEIPSGWDGIGEKDLIILEKEGFLKKISETTDEQDPLEKIIEYEIIPPL